MLGSYPVSDPLVKLHIKAFKNCSQDNLLVRKIVKVCSLVHAETF